jgi:hypothetical protein
LITKLLLHTLDGGFGSGQFKNAAESSGLLMVCDGCGADMVGLGLDIGAHGWFGLGLEHHRAWTRRISTLVGIITIIKELKSRIELGGTHSINESIAINSLLLLLRDSDLILTYLVRLTSFSAVPFSASRLDPVWNSIASFLLTLAAAVSLKSFRPLSSQISLFSDARTPRRCKRTARLSTKRSQPQPVPRLRA